MKGGKLAREVFRHGGRRGPVGVRGLPSTGRRDHGGRRRRGSERGEKRGPEHKGARIDARSPAQAGATMGGSGGRLLLAATGPIGGDEKGGKVRRGHGGGPEGGDGMDRDVRERAWEDAMEGPHKLGGS